MALKTTNKNRKKVSIIEAKVELHNHEQKIEHKTANKSNHKLFFGILGLIAIISYFII